MTRPSKSSAAKVSKAAEATSKKSEALNGEAGVNAWMEGVKLAHRPMVKRIDALIGKMIPGVRRAIKWRKPSQPLGVPFYGVTDQGWLVALWSLKDRVGVGFFAGTLLDPEPPVTSMAGPWNRGTTMKARRIDIPDGSNLDEAQLRSWLAQVRKLPGWAKGCEELK